MVAPPHSIISLETLLSGSRKHYGFGRVWLRIDGGGLVVGVVAASVHFLFCFVLSSVIVCFVIICEK